MFGRKKNTSESPRRTPREESDQVIMDFREELDLTTATSLVANGIYTSLEQAVMETLTRDTWSYDSKYRIHVTDEEAAAYDDGSELAEARAKLDHVRNLSDEEVNALIQKGYDDEKARRQENIADTRERIARLGVVFEQAQRWSPPDELSGSFKQKFSDNITKWISDNNREIARLEAEPIARPSVSEYRDRQIAIWSQRVANLESRPSSKARYEAEDAKRDAWVEGLRRSLASTHTSK